jgi:hypothetical protein
VLLAVTYAAITIVVIRLVIRITRLVVVHDLRIGVKGKPRTTD